MKTKRTKATLVAILSAATLSGCIMPNGGLGGAGLGSGGLGAFQAAPPTPSFAVTTHTGSVETISTSFTPGAGASPGSVRVCLNNQRPGQRSVDLNLQGVNPMSTIGRNQQSCVSVGSNQTVNLLAAAGRQAAHISPSTINLAPYDGGLLTLVWN